MQITHYSCHILIKPQFSQQVFEEGSNIKFHKVVPQGLTDRQTDRQTR
jgi:predicted transcriptional regulator